MNDPISPANKTSNIYFAADETRECADEVLARCNDYWTFALSKGWFTTWRRLYYAYNPNRYTLGQTVNTGESNEYRSIKVNEFRNILEHVANLSVTDRPAWQPTSTNSDSKSQNQCIIATGVLDYYMREKRVERHLRDALRYALVFTEGFILTEWDPSKGKLLAYDEETDESKHEGDIVYSSFEPVDVIRDPNLKSFNERSWVAVRKYENKYDLAARFPEYATEIISQQTGISSKDHYLVGQFLDRSPETDLIPTINFFHAKTPACTDGRQMIMLTDGTVLMDSPLLYDHIPLHRIAPSNQIGSPMGQSMSLDLLPLQEMIDAHYTTILSINENYGIPKVMLPIGSDIMTDTLQAGFQVITYNAQSGKPEVLNMPQVPATIFSSLENIKQTMETLSGVNSVTRGNPEASLKSGSALALVQSMAIQFNSPLQASYIQLLEDVGTATIEILKLYASEPRIIKISGKKNKGIITQSFSSEDIDSISRVHVEAGNPMSKTISGKLSIAQDLLQNKLINTADEYLMVLQTGQLEPLIDGKTKELQNLSNENELLSEGKDVPVLFTDNHVLHIQEHTALASDPVVRQDPERFSIISQHIMQHISMLSDPNYQNFRQLMNQPSLPPAQQPQNPGNVMTPEPNMGNGDIQQMAQNVNMPKPPVNPLTNERQPLPGQQ